MEESPQTPDPPVAARWTPSFGAFLIFGVVVIVLDQITKLWIISKFGEAESGHSLVIVPGFLQIIYRVNTGAAFSIFQEHPEYLRIFATLVALGVAGWAWILKPEEKVLRWPLGMVFGGAIGNLIDRYRIGHVIDFIDAHWHESYHFPTFNVADSAICVGMGMLILLSLFAPNRQ